MNLESLISKALLLTALALLSGCGKAPEPEPEAKGPVLREVTVPAQPVSTPPAKPGLATTGNITTSATAPPPPPQPRQLTQEEQQVVLNGMMKEMADAQAKGLGGGTVTVNGAWIYSGYSHLAPDPDSPLPARLVAVDVTIEGHNVNFDIDDIEIIDGLSMVSYGSDPHVTFLAGNTEPLAEGSPIPAAPEPTRALLIYAFPKSTPKFTLYYWGKNLLEEPMSFEESGWGLPYPADPE